MLTMREGCLLVAAATRANGMRAGLAITLWRELRTVQLFDSASPVVHIIVCGLRPERWGRCIATSTFEGLGKQAVLRRIPGGFGDKLARVSASCASHQRGTLLLERHVLRVSLTDLMDLIEALIAVGVSQLATLEGVFVARPPIQLLYVAL